MSSIIKASGLTKRYRNARALDGADFNIEAGRIVGLIGPNGAGKTTALKAIMGLIDYDGELDVLGHNPRRDRHQLMRDMTFIADVAVLPRWIRVRQLLDYMQNVHPRFNRELAMSFIERTKIQLKSRVKELSKGMVTQLHLALVMAVDAKLLILDEPTLGLDILYRQSFYEQLLNDYFDDQRTIVITTHQVEEIEHILSDVMFIRDGRIILDSPMDDLAERFTELEVGPEALEAAQALGPMKSRQLFGKHRILYDGVERAKLRELGEIRQPGLADLFVAMMQEQAA